MPRFYVSPEYIKDKKIVISSAEARHIKNVLRVGKGDMITVFDGTGREYAVLVENMASTKVEGRIIEERMVQTETQIEITLFQGLPKSGKMDFVIEKCTELGAKKIVPVLTARSIPDIDEKNINKRMARWERIAREATKQCGRTQVPQVSKIIQLQDAFKEKFDLCLILWEGEKDCKLKDVLNKYEIFKYPCRVGIFIGPEGGFTREEIGQARYNNAISISLGPRILRTETAGMTATAIVMYELEPKNTLTR